MTPDQRLLESFSRFEEGLVFTEAGIAAQLGTQDETRIMSEVIRRMEIVRRHEEREIYHLLPAES
jgi:hypothetical protein